jgi:hypothetical protein
MVTGYPQEVSEPPPDAKETIIQFERRGHPSIKKLIEQSRNQGIKSWIRISRVIIDTKDGSTQYGTHIIGFNGEVVRKIPVGPYSLLRKNPGLSIYPF